MEVKYFGTEGVDENPIGPLHAITVGRDERNGRRGARATAPANPGTGVLGVSGEVDRFPLRRPGLRR